MGLSLETNANKQDGTKPRIAIVVTLPIIGGAQTHILDLVKELAEEYEFHVISGFSGPLLDRLKSMEVKTYIAPNLIRSIHPLKDYKAMSEIAGLLRRIRPDIVHLHSSKAGIVGRAVAAALGIPVVFTVHGWAFTEGAPPLNRLIGWVLEFCLAPLASEMIAVSRYDAQLAKRLHVAVGLRLTVVHSGIPDIVSPKKPQHTPMVLGVMVARFSPPKDQQLVLRALAQVPDLQLMFVGGGELLEESKVLALELGVWDRVTFVGEASDVTPYLWAADFFALASRYEGFPIVILEAMRAGLPVLASDVGGVSEAVDRWETGLLIGKDSLEQWIDALRRIKDNRELRQRMGLAGRRRYEKAFLVSEMADQVRAVYERNRLGRNP